MKFLLVFLAVFFVTEVTSYRCPNPIFPSYPCERERTIDCGGCTSGSSCVQSCNTYPEYTHPTYNNPINGYSFNRQPIDFGGLGNGNPFGVTENPFVANGNPFGGNFNPIGGNGNPFGGYGYNFPISHQANPGGHVQTFPSQQPTTFGSNVFPAQHYPSVMPTNYQPETFYPGMNAFPMDSSIHQFQGHSTKPVISLKSTKK